MGRVQNLNRIFCAIWGNFVAKMLKGVEQLKKVVEVSCGEGRGEGGGFYKERLILKWMMVFLSTKLRCDSVRVFKLSWGFVVTRWWMWPCWLVNLWSWWIEGGFWIFSMKGNFRDEIRRTFWVQTNFFLKTDKIGEPISLITPVFTL